MNSAQFASAVQQANQTQWGNTQVAVAQAAAAVTAQQQFIINSFKGTIYVSNTLDVEDTPLYDTITYSAGQTVTITNSHFFTNVGSNAGKTDAQTNMTRSQELPAPEAFAVFGIRLGWSEDVLRSDLTALLNGWDYQMWLSKKVYQQANIRHFSAGWGIAGATTKTGESFYTNGWPSRNSINMLSVKLVIANQQSFDAYLSGNNAGQALSGSGTGLILINELVGLYARGVQ